MLKGSFFWFVFFCFWRVVARKSMKGHESSRVEHRLEEKAECYGKLVYRHRE